MSNLEIEDILRAEKFFPAPLIWSRSKENVVRTRTALEIDGEIKGHFFLEINATTHTRLQIADFVLVYQGIPISRMRFNPNSPHTNKLRKGMPRILKGLHLRAGEHRYYSWDNNKHLGFPPPKGLHMDVAEVVTEKLNDFAAAAGFFCGKTNIAGQIPAPPHEPLLEEFYK